MTDQELYQGEKPCPNCGHWFSVLEGCYNCNYMRD